jgi:hypothetical protein
VIIVRGFFFGAPEPFRSERHASSFPPLHSELAASSTIAMADPSDDIQAVAMWCNLEMRVKRERWSATTIPADHPVFSKQVLPVPALIEVPLVLYRLGTWSDNVAELDNQAATYLNIDPDSGFAPPAWQECVGTVVVARKDRKPLLVLHLEVVWDYCSHILDCFGDGEGAPIKLYNRQAFQKYWEDYCAKQKLRSTEEGAENLNDLGMVKSPYEI